MGKVSIIIPVYNAEKTLKTCLDSIICQTLDDIEIICVDDGSVDNSPEILREYAQNDSRVKIITQLNSGQGIARNKGIEAAQGEFIGFADADDTIEPIMYEKLYNTAKKLDVDCVHANYRVIYTATNMVQQSQLVEAMNIRTGKKIFYYDIPMYIEDIKANIISLFSGPIWNKIYKTSVIKEHNIKFPLCRMQEDTCFNVNTHLFFKRFACIKDVLYNYKVHSQSISTGVSNVHFDIFDSFKDLKTILTDNDFWNKYENYYEDYIYLTFLIHFPHIPENQRAEFIERFKPYLREEKFKNLKAKYLQ